MAGVIFFNFEQKLNKFVAILKRLEYLCLNNGFIKMKITLNHFKIHKALKENLKNMKDQFISNLKKKEQEIYLLNKTLKIQEESYSGLKTREADLLKNLNSKAKVLTNLEIRKKSLPSIALAVAPTENSAKKMKFYEDKVYFSLISNIKINFIFER